MSKCSMDMTWHTTAMAGKPILHIKSEVLYMIQQDTLPILKHPCIIAAGPKPK
jgi:hypothetical protein